MTRSPLDDAFAYFTPAQLLNHPKADGDGITVAMIDTGLDRETIAKRHPGHAAIRTLAYRDKSIVETNDPPSGSHGTTVADIVLTVAKKVSLISIDLFGMSNTDVDAVVASLDWCVKQKAIHVINMSLGVSERALMQWPKRQALSRAIEAAYFAGITVVAAANNDHPLAISYPAAIAPPLLSVDKSLLTDVLAFQYQPHDGVEFVAKSKGYLGPFVQEPMTSWATPHLAGIVARLMSLKSDLQPFEIKAILYRMSHA